jgi:hypothetical protein
MILSNGQVGPPLPTLQPHTTPTAALPSSENDWKKNYNPARDDNTQEHLKTREHSTELCGTSNFSTGTETIPSEPSYKA